MRKKPDTRKVYRLRRRTYQMAAERNQLAGKPIKDLFTPRNQVLLFEQTLKEKRINLRNALDSLAEKYRNGHRGTDKLWEPVKLEMEKKTEQLMFGSIKKSYPKLDFSLEGAQRYYKNPQTFVQAAGSREEAVKVITEIKAIVKDTIKARHQINSSKAKTTRDRIIALSAGDFFGHFLTNYQYFQIMKL